VILHKICGMQNVPIQLTNQILQAIHDSAVDSIIIIDHRGMIRSVNPATAGMFGYLPEEIIGHNVSLLMPSPFREEHDQYVERFLATREPKIIGFGREVEALRKDGSRFPIHLAVSEIVQDAHTFFVGYVRNLSQYKAAERAMQTQILVNERLAAIGQTVSGLAHESRNALQRSHACLAELELDLDGMPNSLNLVRKVQRALDDLHQLLEEVRNYSAPIILERRTCSVEQLIRETWQNLVDVKGQSTAPKLTIHVHPEFPPTCLIDPARFRQVLLNLFDNAWFACLEPKEVQVKLDFDARKSEKQVGLCRIQILDNGPGVREEDLDQIFSPFYTTKTKGTGLGLALCRRYVEAHGGKIFLSTDKVDMERTSFSAQSEKLSGARFVMEFPHERN
jgi:two-component system, LuxR family, sensor kinase FixL